MNEARNEHGMGEIVMTVARLLRGVILLYGIYLVLYGHITPGGGFAGGVVIACGFVLLTIAGGRQHGLRFFSQRAAATLDSLGVLLEKRPRHLALDDALGNGPVTERHGDERRGREGG